MQTNCAKASASGDRQLDVDARKGRFAAPAAHDLFCPHMDILGNLKSCRSLGQALTGKARSPRSSIGRSQSLHQATAEASRPNIFLDALRRQSTGLPLKLARLAGTPKCPILIDVRIDDDFNAAPRLIPGSRRRDFQGVDAWKGALMDRQVVVICQKGLKLSHGTAAVLRGAVMEADGVRTSDAVRQILPKCLLFHNRR